MISPFFYMNDRFIIFTLIKRDLLLDLVREWGFELRLTFIALSLTSFATSFSDEKNSKAEFKQLPDLEFNTALQRGQVEIHYKFKKSSKFSKINMVV